MRLRQWGLMVAMLLALLAPMTTYARQGSACDIQRANLASLGKPSGDATLLASVRATQPNTPPPSNASPTTYVVQPGDTLWKIAKLHNTTIDALVAFNGLSNPNHIVSGQLLRIPGTVATTPTAAPAAPVTGVAPLPAPFDAAWIRGEAVQGQAAQIWLRVAPGMRVEGWLGQQRIPFHSQCDLLWGLVAFDALLDAPGGYQLTLYATNNAGRSTKATVPLTLRPGHYPVGNVISYPDDRQRLLEKELIRAENQRLNDLFAALPYSPPRWSGAWRLPLDSYVTNIFGYMGSVNGGPPTGYHEGIDYRGAVGTPFVAPAPGVVVLAEPLTVRGGTIFLDHGAGVVTGYFHLSQIGVKVGDVVNAGTILGKVGATGLVTGPHLHWEARVNGRWVNPDPFVRRTVP